MRVLFCIAVYMVHPVHHCIGPGIQKRRTLSEPGKKIKQFFGSFAGGIHLVRCISVQEKSMEKQG